MVADRNELYGTVEYWNERYSTEESFDWFKDYSQIRELLVELIPNKDSRILMLGCGNSTLSGDMYNDGFTNITNIDVRLLIHLVCISGPLRPAFHLKYSAVVIENMKKKHVDKTMECKDTLGSCSTFG